MLRNSRLAVRMLLMLLFAIIGHETLMVGAHASPHLEEHSPQALHEVDRQSGESWKSSIRLAGHSDSGDCAPGREFARRVDETIAFHEQIVSATTVALTTDEESTQRLAANEAPGQPSAQRRALLQVFLN